MDSESPSGTAERPVVFVHTDAERLRGRHACAMACAVAAGRGIGRWMSPPKVPECMAAGKPIPASGIPAPREILRHGGTALLLPPGEPQTRAEAAPGSLRDLGRAAASGAKARAALLADPGRGVRATRIPARLPRFGGAAVAA
jgi:glycosyltransferase involved in cell wall biosynthesis